MKYDKFGFCVYGEVLLCSVHTMITNYVKPIFLFLILKHLRLSVFYLSEVFPVFMINFIYLLCLNILLL